jgi:hypothetical protein
MFEMERGSGRHGEGERSATVANIAVFLPCCCSPLLSLVCAVLWALHRYIFVLINAIVIYFILSLLVLDGGVDAGGFWVLIKAFLINIIMLWYLYVGRKGEKEREKREKEEEGEEGEENTSSLTIAV